MIGDPLSVQAALIEHGVGLLGGLQGGVFAVLADQDRGGAVDVEFVNRIFIFAMVAVTLASSAAASDAG